MLFPVLGFFDQHFFRLSFVADHWQYYSIIAPITLVVVAGEWIGRRLGGQRRQWATALGVAVLLVLGEATWTRAGVYVDAETLWRDNVARNPDAYMAQNNLGTLLAQTGRLEEAIAHLEQTLRRGPDVFETHYNLGGALAAAGRTQEAIQQFEQALRLKPDDAEAHNNLANTLLQAGRAAEAVAHYEQALRLKPDLAQTHYNLGVAFEQMGRIEAAIGHYEQALRIKPDYAEARNSLAQLRAVQ
jgi:tetratricopeptide (TPR) repeat protein